MRIFRGSPFCHFEVLVVLTISSQNQAKLVPDIFYFRRRAESASRVKLKNYVSLSNEEGCVSLWSQSISSFQSEKPMKSVLSIQKER